MLKLKPSLHRNEQHGLRSDDSSRLHRCGLGSSFGLHALCESGFGASFPVVLSDLKRDVTCQPCRDSDSTNWPEDNAVGFVVSLFPLLWEDFDRVLRFFPLVIKQSNISISIDAQIW